MQFTLLLYLACISSVINIVYANEPDVMITSFKNKPGIFYNKHKDTKFILPWKMITHINVRGFAKICGHLREPLENITSSAIYIDALKAHNYFIDFRIIHEIRTLEKEQETLNNRVRDELHEFTSALPNSFYYDSEIRIDNERREIYFINKIEEVMRKIIQNHERLIAKIELLLKETNYIK